ncbi:MAG: PEGA domain-containing protein [Deltaproteobacteria bacterium]|nr:PEGA domain-containing protein [Deltaproteobacteria bacterium]
MRSEKQHDNDCRRYEALATRRIEGDLLAAEDLDFMERHRRNCRDCAMSDVLEDLVRYHDAHDGPLAPLDDLAARRRVNDVVDAAFRDQSQRTSRRERPYKARLWWMSAAAVVGLAALLAGVVLLVNRSGRHGRRVAPHPAVARVLFLSGVVTAMGPDGTVRTIDPTKVLRSGRTLAIAERLDVGDGTVVISLPCAATVLLAAGSVVRFERLGRSQSRLFLESGRLVASVTPEHRPDRVVIDTADGRIAVKGTVFAVSRHRTGTFVSVLRGIVAVSDRHGHHRHVGSGQGMDVGGAHARQLSGADLVGLRQNLQVIGLLSDAPTRLMVRSSPAGASVEIDGVFVGQSPVLLALRSGGHRLSVRLDGYGRVDETIDVPQRGEAVRTIVLARQVRSSLGSGALSNEPNVPIKSGSARGTGVRRRSPTEARSSSKGRVVSPGGANALMILARSRRMARDWRGAAATYRRLLAQYPSSRLVGTARVALGEILLDHLGSPSGALRQFDAYLRGRLGGMLGQEARYGKIRALRSLGQTGAERTAIEQFLLRYPRAVQADFLRKRLAKLETGRGMGLNMGAGQQRAPAGGHRGGRR